MYWGSDPPFNAFNLYLVGLTHHCMVNSIYGGSGTPFYAFNPFMEQKQKIWLQK